MKLRATAVVAAVAGIVLSLFVATPAQAVASPSISPSNSYPGSPDYIYLPAGTDYPCPSGTLCVGAWDSNVGQYKVFFLYYCYTYALSNFIGNGFYWDNQTSGTTSYFYDQNGVKKKTIVAPTSGTYNWDPIWSIKNC